MGKSVGVARNSKLMTAMALALTVAACGGGGGGGGTSRPLPTPTPTPSPAPAPAPTPTPTPTASFTLEEYQSSEAAFAAGALTAYDQGASGAGVIIAVGDTGINPDLSEFTGRIHSSSGDLAGTRGVGDVDGHGTAVSAVAAAAGDGEGMMGVAYEAIIASYRIDDPGSCALEDDCAFFDNDIEQAINAAINAGARVINLSLGGGSISDNVVSRMQLAADAGIVIVISAGNESEANPTLFALDAARRVTGGTIIIAGSIGVDTGSGTDLTQLSDFSNQAGDGAAWYLSALGYRVLAPDQNGDFFLWSGTSFSAPAISGAVALLAQAFPSLTGAEIVEILFDSATDLGADGVDNVFGHGALDLAAAFAPAGTTSVAGTQTAMSLVDNGQLPAAAGDAAQGAMSTIITDKYDRAYALDISRTLSLAEQRQPLHQALNGSSMRNHSTDFGAFAITMAMTPGGENKVNYGPLFEEQGNVDQERARLIAGSVIARLDDKTKVALGYSESASTLSKRLSGGDGASFLVARDGMDGTGFTASRDHSVALRHQFGGLGVTVASEAGSRWTRLAEDGEEARYRLDAVSVDRKLFGQGRVRLGLSLLDERETLLGGRLSAALGDDGKGAQTRFVDLGIDQPLGDGFALGLSARRGWTDFGGGAFQTGAYAFDVRRDGVFGPGDRLALRVSQPLRVESGGLNLYLPQSWDYATETATMGWQQLSLVPSGRELIGEVAYGRGLFGGRLDLNAYYRHQPQHIAAADGDVGAAIRFTLGY